MMPPSNIRHLHLFLTILWVVGGAACASEEICAAPKGPSIEVASVDIHLELRLRDGRKLKLKGIDPARGTRQNPGLAEETRAILAGWVENRLLDADITSVGPDRWGRHSASVAGPAGDAGMPTLSAELIAAGRARVDPQEIGPDCLISLFRLETGARLGGLGLWGDPDYRVLNLSSPGEFDGFGGKIIVAEGVISSVGQWRTLTFLNFGDGNRGRTSASVSRRVSAILETRFGSVAAMKGARVRIRGLLQIRQSPRINIFSSEAIEFLSLPSALPQHLVPPKDGN